MLCLFRPVASAVFGQRVNPISTKGVDYAHHSTTSPLGFSDLATALHIQFEVEKRKGFAHKYIRKRNQMIKNLVTMRKRMF